MGKFDSTAPFALTRRVLMSVLISLTAIDSAVDYHLVCYSKDADQTNRLYWPKIRQP
jgi:hypothetical protein